MPLTLKPSKKQAEVPEIASTESFADDPIVVRRKTIAEKAMGNILKVGLPPPDKPAGGEAPRLPDDVDNMDDKELGFYLSIYARWCEYAEYIVSHADIKHALAASNHEYISAKVHLEKTGTVEVKRKKTHADPRYQESLIDMETAFATLRLSKSLLEGYKKIYESLSREITRRQNKFERTRGH